MEPANCRQEKPENVFGGNFVFPEQFWNNPERAYRQPFGFGGAQNFVYQQFNLNLSPPTMPPTTADDVASILKRLMPMPTPMAMETSQPMRLMRGEPQLDELPHLVDLPELDELDSKALGTPLFYGHIQTSLKF